MSLKTFGVRKCQSIRRWDCYIFYHTFYGYYDEGGWNNNNGNSSGGLCCNSGLERDHVQVCELPSLYPTDGPRPHWRHLQTEEREINNVYVGGVFGGCVGPGGLIHRTCWGRRRNFEQLPNQTAWPLNGDLVSWFLPPWLLSSPPLPARTQTTQTSGSDWLSTSQYLCANGFLTLNLKKKRQQPGTEPPLQCLTKQNLHIAKAAEAHHAVIVSCYFSHFNCN